MGSNKTTPTSASVEAFIDSLDDAQQAADSRELVAMMRKVSGQPPVMWGSAIIGFGSYHYKYASGREGDWAQIGFSPRKGKISLYVTFDAAGLTSEFPELGTYKISKGCIYFKRLADVDIGELRKLIDKAYADDVEYPGRADGKEQPA